MIEKLILIQKHASKQDIVEFQLSNIHKLQHQETDILAKQKEPSNIFSLNNHNSPSSEKKNFFKDNPSVMKAMHKTHQS